ncbi:protein amnionless [Drosophila persimilis]|uniref:protein amnionless n=1 Tax=Drosophila persimilis TaxID=7234 RepID=UPI000F081120|nr:protein amnionless [Drosophila persimilis]
MGECSRDIQTNATPPNTEGTNFRTITNKIQLKIHSYGIMWWSVPLPIVGLILITGQVATATKWYSGGADFNSPSAWVDDYMPCPEDLVVFPKYFPAVLPLPEEISIDGIVFPRDGAILIAEESTITFGAPRNTKCDSDEKTAHLKPPKSSKWFDPHTWKWADISKSVSSPVPELERVPCDDEQVIVKGHAPLAFDLENVQHLRLGQLILAGSSISKFYLEQLLARDLGRFLFHNALDVQVEYYRGELCGCHKDFDRLIEPVCHNVQEQCEAPHCLSPVRPFGSCCLICGAVLTMPRQHCSEEDRKTLQNQLNSMITKQDLAAEIQLHVDYVSSEQYGSFLQAIVTDRGGYSERSVEFMQYLSEHRNQSTFLAKQSGLELKSSGRPHNPNVSFASVLLILFCMALVGVVSVIILAHFMPENPYLNRIPQWIHDPRRWRWRHLGVRLRRNPLFNRFENVVAGGGSIEDPRGGVVGVDRVTVMGYDPGNDEVRERSFDNPMFEQGAAQVASRAEASKESPQDQPDLMVAPKMETGDLDNCGVEEQELTEINLESSEGETDEEAQI